MASNPVSNGNSGVYIGAWINWSHGSVRGATITLTPRDGALLIAFLAFYVGLAGSSFWRIACFAIHQMLSSDSVEDGLYHQRQAILRNSATDIVGLWNFMQANWFWRRNANTPFKRMLPLVTFSILNIAIFGIAGVFSSQVTTAAGNEVLISSPNCGHLDGYVNLTATGILKFFEPYGAESMILGASYAQQCYRENANAGSCKVFVQPNISTTLSTAACPFDGICVESGDIALVIDTGHINSHFNLGLNAPPEDRLTVRKVTTCAPITTVGYSTPYHPTNSTADDYIEYYYGPFNSGEPSQKPYSYIHPSHLEMNIMNRIKVWSDYTIGALSASTPAAGIDPIPRLRRSDGDVSLFFLSANSIVYTEPAEDRWYSAHIKSPDVLRGSFMEGNTSVWYRDNPVNVLGCVEQYQYCNPNLPANTSCTALAGLSQVLNMTDGLWQSSAQNATYYSVHYAFFEYGISLDVIVELLGVSSLTARNSLINGIQGPLPNNQ